jgi:hypothetical protein
MSDLFLKKLVLSKPSSRKSSKEKEKQNDKPGYEKTQMGISGVINLEKMKQ